MCGRPESRYCYSAGIVYNNFPWPDPTAAQRAAIEAVASGVLAARATYPDETLANLYDPNLIPPLLANAHWTLDRAVDAAYERRRFTTEADRLLFLFERYQVLIPAAIWPDSNVSRCGSGVSDPVCLHAGGG